MSFTLLITIQFIVNIYIEKNGLFDRKITRMRPGTLGICAAIKHKYDVDTIPHVLCGGFTKEETEYLLVDCHYLGIDNVMALRGDAMSHQKYFEPSNGGNGQIFADPELVQLFEKAEKLASEQQDNYVSIDSLLISSIQSDNNIEAIIKKVGLNLNKIQSKISEIRKSSKSDSESSDDNFNALEKYTINVTQKAQNRELDPVIGRDEEIRRTIQVLSRRTKNNPILIGDPGVGKTALIEGLAQRIVNKDVPRSLENKVIRILDLGLLLAGAKYRGEFEERLQNVLKEIHKENGTIILFIDEIHTLVGAGKSDGAMDASNMFGHGMGENRIKLILDEYPDILTMKASSPRKREMVVDIDGFAEKTAKKFVKNIPAFKKFIRENGLEYKLEYTKEQASYDTSHPLYEKNILMTGFRDEDFKMNVRNVGGKIASGISSNVDVLVVKSLDSTTSKMKKAQELGVDIMTKDQFISSYL